MIYVFIFMLCEIKKLLYFTCIFHTCVYAFVKCFRNIQVDSIMLLSTLATDRWYLGRICCVGQYFCNGLFLCNFEHFV